MAPSWFRENSKDTWAVVVDGQVRMVKAEKNGFLRRERKIDSFPKGYKRVSLYEQVENESCQCDTVAAVIQIGPLACCVLHAVTL